MTIPLPDIPSSDEEEESVEEHYGSDDASDVLPDNQAGLASNVDQPPELSSSESSEESESPATPPQPKKATSGGRKVEPEPKFVDSDVEDEVPTAPPKKTVKRKAPLLKAAPTAKKRANPKGGFTAVNARPDEEEEEHDGVEQSEDDGEHKPIVPWQHDVKKATLRRRMGISHLDDKKKQAVKSRMLRRMCGGLSGLDTSILWETHERKGRTKPAIEGMSFDTPINA